MLERKKTLNVFKDSKNAWGSYDDYPVGPKGTDPMPHLSRNRVAQPFFLIAEEDQVLIQMAGEGALELRETEPQMMTLVPGDSVYIPAGIPTRVVPKGEMTQLRLKAEPPGREAVAWYCPQCNALVHTVELAAGIVQERYWEAVLAFNGDEKLRACGECKAIHPEVELGDIAWLEVARAIESDD